MEQAAAQSHANPEQVRRRQCWKDSAWLVPAYLHTLGSRCADGAAVHECECNCAALNAGRTAHGLGFLVAHTLHTIVTDSGKWAEFA